MNPTKPKPTPPREFIHAMYRFTDPELVELSRELGRTCSEITSLEAQKSAVTKDFASRIETREILRDSLVDKVTSGYEMRETECLVEYDPPNRSKDYHRIEPGGVRGEFIERREMTAADFQLTLKTEPEPD